MRQVFHTAGDPPRSGSTMRANNGSTQNRRSALVSAVRANRRIRGRPMRRASRVN
jgi:hypothetical protein